MEKAKVVPVEETMTNIRGKCEGLRSRIFPPKSEILKMCCLNLQITMIDYRNRNTIHGWHLHMYYLQKGRFHTKEIYNKNRLHCNVGCERVAQNRLRLWKEIRAEDKKEEKRIIERNKCKVEKWKEYRKSRKKRNKGLLSMKKCKKSHVLFVRAE